MEASETFIHNGCLEKREKVGSISITSKEDKFQITSIYISINEEIEKNKNKNLYGTQIYEKDIFKKNQQKILDILTFEFIDCKNFILLFNPFKFQQVFNKRIEDLHIFPFPYIITIHIRDMEKCLPDYFYEFKLVADKITIEDNNLQININKINKEDNIKFTKEDNSYNIYYQEENEIKNKNLKCLLNYY